MPSSFTRPLVVKKLKGRMWMTFRSFSYHVGSEESEEVITVPKNFKTDFASVPRIFWTILPPDGEYTQCAVLHDYTYFKKLYARKKCDYIFYESMGVKKVPLWKRWVMWKAVRVGGWVGWGKHRKKEAK